MGKDHSLIKKIIKTGHIGMHGKGLTQMKKARRRSKVGNPSVMKEMTCMTQGNKKGKDKGARPPLCPKHRLRGMGRAHGESLAVSKLV